MTIFNLIKIYFSLFIFIIIFNNVSAQTDNQVEYDTVYSKRKIELIRRDDTVEEYKKGDIDLYISPFAVLEPRPTIYLGGEYFIKDRFSVYTDLGYMINLTGIELNTEADPTLSTQEDQVNQTILNSSKANYVIKTEFRWYRKYSSPKDAAYYGIRLMWRNVNYLKNQRTFEEYAFSTLTNNWTGIGEENISIYKVRRRSVGVQFLIGWKNNVFKKINSNWYMGVGVRYISNLPTKKTFDPFEDFNSSLEELNLEFLSFNKQYKIVTMDFALGMRFGGRVKQ
ncbi:hypothetical protein ACE193_00750 [Bernardetia sp. OM2101]|uniref:hypothetical protein n=1 Tax=Bernardetia sp. OM2101 TaxID=3344876 RepID=UPI0035CF1969